MQISLLIIYFKNSQNFTCNSCVKKKEMFQSKILTHPLLATYICRNNQLYRIECFLMSYPYTNICRLLSDKREE